MSRKLLLVDDDPNLLSSLQRSLRREDYEICCATSAESALKILNTEPIDVVVSDQDMPGMKGTDFLAKVLRDYPDTVRFMLTGKATLEVALQAINNGAISRFFIKPCNIIDLAVSIRQALQQKELLQQARRLLQKVQNQSAVLQEVEREAPGITKVKRDAQGAVLLENIPENFEAFMKEVQETLT